MQLNEGYKWAQDKACDSLPWRWWDASRRDNTTRPLRATGKKSKQKMPLVPLQDTARGYFSPPAKLTDAPPSSNLGSQEDDTAGQEQHNTQHSCCFTCLGRNNSVSQLGRSRCLEFTTITIFKTHHHWFLKWTLQQTWQSLYVLAKKMSSVMISRLVPLVIVKLWDHCAVMKQSGVHWNHDESMVIADNAGTNDGEEPTSLPVCIFEDVFRWYLTAPLNSWYWKLHYDYYNAPSSHLGGLDNNIVETNGVFHIIQLFWKATALRTQHEKTNNTLEELQVRYYYSLQIFRHQHSVNSPRQKASLQPLLIIPTVFHTPSPQQTNNNRQSINPNC